MAVPVNINIGNRAYKMAVDEGQDARLLKVAEFLDQYVEKMQKTLGTKADRDQMLIFAALQMADDFYALREEKEAEENALALFHNTLADRLEDLVSS